MDNFYNLICTISFVTYQCILSEDLIKLKYEQMQQKIHDIWFENNPLNLVEQKIIITLYNKYVVPENSKKFKNRFITKKVQIKHSWYAVSVLFY